MVTHESTWDDCQQHLQVLFTTEEQEQVTEAAQKLVLGANGQPTTVQTNIDLLFPLVHSD